MTCIVIPAADVVPDAASLLGALLLSIEKQNIADKYKVIVCFDACREDFVRMFVKNYPFIIPEMNSGNRLNFAGNANRGLRRAHREFGMGAIVVNQDCVLPALQFFEQITGDGICVPHQVTLCAEPPITDADLAALNKVQPEFQMREQHTKLVGFCMYLSKELMDKVGYFDEHFKATWEDDDICARAALAGFPVEAVTVNVHHYVSRCGSYDGQRLMLNMAKYRIKWSIPLEVPHAQMNDWIIKNHVWQDAMREQ